MPNNLQRSRWLNWRIRRWVRRQCPLIDPRIEFTGQTDPRPFLHFGGPVTIERGVTIWTATEAGSSPRLSIGAGAFIGCYSYLGTFLPVSIGRNTLIGAYTYIISCNHQFARRDQPISEQGFIGAPVVIGDDVWIGTHVVILPGAEVGEGAIIAAGSVVNGKVPTHEIWGGVPAKFIKQRP